MNEQEWLQYLSTQGEKCSSEFHFTWINPGRIEAGEALAPARLVSKAARDFAALHLILGDLAFAKESLDAAIGIDIPSDKNLHSKALIFSGVVAYARSFKTGVRPLTLKPTKLKSQGAPFDEEIHDCLIDLRDKHIAHSVNEFEQCEAIAIMVGTPGGSWRDGSAIGVVKKQTIGITAAQIRNAISHIRNLHSFLEKNLSNQRNKIYAEFKESLEQTGQWEMAPIMKISDRTKIADRRK